MSTTKPIVQINVHINDFIPTEDTRKWKKILDKHTPPVNYTMKQLKKSIKRDGIKDQIRILSSGEILNGNARYWIARALYEAGDMRFEYLPVEVEHYAGMMQIHHAEKPTEEKELREHFLAHVNKKIPVVPVGQLQDADYLGKKAKKDGKGILKQQGKWEVVIYKTRYGTIKQLSLESRTLERKE